MNIKQISVFLENRPGAMIALTDALAENKIDMRALSLAEAGDFGIVRIIVNNVNITSDILKEEGFVFTVTSVVGVKIPNEPGGLKKVLWVLEKSKINVEYMYAFLGSSSPENAYLIFKVQDDIAAAEALNKEDIHTLDQEEVADF